MAQQFVSTDGNFIIPDSYPKISVQAQNAGLSVSGVIALVGEAATGPAYSQETDLLENVARYGPNSMAAVVAKYGSGPVVDAFRAAIDPANDPNITGSPTAFVIVKTNAGSKASAIMSKVGGGTYATAFTKLQGAAGNQLYMNVFADGTNGGTAEVVPTTGAFTWINNVASLNLSFRINGGASAALTVGANTAPTALVTAINGLGGSPLIATGGAVITLLPGIAGNLSVSGASGASATFNYTGVWSAIPAVGSTMIIPSGSAIAGAGTANVGAYVVTASSTNSITATKLSDGGRGGAVAGVVTNPVNVGSVAVASTTDIQAQGAITVALTAANAIDGVGKSLEWSELTTGTDLLSRYVYALSATPVTYISKAAGSKLITSATEYSVEVDFTRVNDGVAEELTAGGQVALSISYTGTTATLTITATTLTTSVVGGSGANLNLTLSSFATIADLVNYIAAQTGYKCSVGTTTLGQLPPTSLDQVVAAGICSDFGAQNGRIKVDAYKLFTIISSSSAVVDMNSPIARAAAGLPATQTIALYFTGGSLGGSSTANFTGGMDALESCTVNFLVPCVSRDSAADIQDNLTDSSSSYSIDSINAYARTHVGNMSKVKRKRNRQAFVSKRDTFLNARNAASNLASARVAMTFQDVKVTNSQGNLAQQQPYIGAAVAAGMQAAGFYRAIVRKFANISGAVQAAGDFNDRNDDNLETALLAGLLPLKRHINGGFYWVSDQTTYTKDTNFVYNSIQMMYAADIVALTTAQRMADAFAGQSVADVSASAALTFLQGVMADFRRLKLIAPSDDAPAGFKNAKITISGPAMIVEVEIKLAGAIYFIPISFLVSPVQQTASQG